MGSTRNRFYLGEGDQPGLNLVRELLDESNYLFWSRSMERALRAKGKLGFVNGKIEEPKVGEADRELWESVDATVMCWIMNSMPEEIAKGFVFAETAKALWDEIYDVFGVAVHAVRDLQIYRLNRELWSLKQGNDSVTGYYFKLVRIWGELDYLKSVKLEPKPCDCDCDCDCGCHKEYKTRLEEDKLHQFLMGLNNTFDVVRNVILFTEPLPSLRKAYSMVLVSEETGKLMSSGNGAARPAKCSECKFCGKKGHIRENCFKLQRLVRKEHGRGNNPVAAQNIDFAHHGY